MNIKQIERIELEFYILTEKVISLDEKLNNLVIKRKQTRRKFGHRTQNGKQLNYFLLGLYHLKEYQIDSSYSILREKSECTYMYINEIHLSLRLHDYLKR